MDSFDDKRRILYAEPARAPIYSVSHYVAYLRRFVTDTAPPDTRSSSGRADKKDKSSRALDRKSTPGGIDPLSYFLRKLKLDLKVAYDSFVSDFVRPQNGGLGLLLRLLANLQQLTSGQRSKSSFSMNKSTLQDYKKTVTDVHDCLLCIKFCLRVQSAIGQLMENADGLQQIAAGVHGSSSKARITCLEILTLCLLDSRGVDRVVEAFTVQRLYTGQSVRFKMLVSMLHTKSPSQLMFQVTCLKLFNTLLNACSSANQRVYLQQEFLQAGLEVEFLKQCAEGDGLEYDDLRREINEWETRFIDVDTLLKKLKGGSREHPGNVNSDQESLLLMSTRKNSMHGIQDMTYCQPYDLSGSVHMELNRDFDQNITHRHGKVASETVLQRSSVSQSSARPQTRPINRLEVDDNDSVFLSISAQSTPHNNRRNPSQDQPLPQTRGTRQENGFHLQNIVSSSIQHLQKGALCTTPKPNRVDSTQRRGHQSEESVLDAYGLVIRRQDTREEFSEGRDFESPRGVYSNWKLQYFSTPGIPGMVNEARLKGNPGKNYYGPAETSSKNSYNSHVLEDRPFADKQASVVWNTSLYPYGQRALYRGHENGTVVDRYYSTQTAGKDLSENTKHKLLVPDPDYTPLTTPRGSNRSLNTEVARVLREFENTLREHEPSRPPSVGETSSVVFV